MQPRVAGGRIQVHDDLRGVLVISRIMGPGADGGLGLAGDEITQELRFLAPKKRRKCKGASGI